SGTKHLAEALEVRLLENDWLAGVRAASTRARNNTLFPTPFSPLIRVKKFPALLSSSLISLNF
ncbi:hypothetical protein, partial [Tritonibacter mobilis]|uniref:hypothetical protein n=1 Tax=Tritonibacter mobilis TaxID=379347 RepID=UPI00195505D8